jgi:hypothetical protein
VEFEEICKVYGKPVPELVPERYRKMMEQVVPHGHRSKIPWRSVMPKEIFAAAKELQQAQMDSILLDINQDIDYLTEIYVNSKRVFDYLQPAKIDAVRYKLYTLDADTKNAVESFKPDKYGFLPVPKYSICDTLTGRQKITEGPNILLLPRKLRDVLQSRFGKDGNIWYLDYTSLEPRVALSVKSYICNGVLIGDLPLAELLKIPAEKMEPQPQDIYAHALKQMKLSSEIDRDMLKQIVLPQLYGQAKSATIEALESKRVRDPDEIVDMVNDYFGIDVLREYTLQEFIKSDQRLLRAFYHRHLSPDDSKPHALLNYYVQSTAVDVALMGFLAILQKLATVPEANKVIIPIFVLHDALILDVHNDAEHLIPKLCKVGAEGIPGFAGQRFWLSGSKKK